MHPSRHASVLAMSLCLFGRAWADLEPPDLPPAAIYPVLGRQNVHLEPSGGITIQWGAVPGAEAYDFEIGAYPFGPALSFFSSETQATSLTVPDFPRGASLVWHVRGKNAAGAGSWGAYSFETEPLLPLALLLPSTSALVAPQPSVRFEWNDPNLPALPTPGAPATAGYSYQLQVCTDPQFPTPALTPMPGFPPPPPYIVNATFTAEIGRQLIDTTFPGFTHDKTYYWRVKGTSSISSFGNWSPVNSFTTAPPPPSSITLVDPAPGAINVPVIPILKWSDAVNRPVPATITGMPPTYPSYWLRLETDSTFPDTPVPSPIMPVLPAPPYLINEIVNDTVKTVPQTLLPGTKYYWRVMIPESYGGDASFASGSFTVVPLRPEIPAPLSPAGGAVDVPLAGPLQWAASARAVSYRIQWGTDSVFADPAATAESTTTKLSLPARLAPSLAYFWRVRAENGGGFSPYCESVRFQTVPPVPGIPALVAPRNDSLDVPTNPTLRWSAVPGATTYHVQLAADSGFGSLLFSDSGLIASEKALPALPKAKPCFWRVRAKNAGGAGAWTAAFTFTVLPPLPGAPQGLAPTPDSAFASSPILVWTQTNFAAGYRVQVDDDSGFAAPLVSQSGLSDTSFTVGPLPKAGTYFWRVAASNSQGMGPWSAVRPFFLLPDLPPGVTLAFPAAGDTLREYGLTARWRSAGQTVIRYRIQIAHDSAFASPLADSILTDTAESIAFAAADGRYWWRVQAWNVTGWGPFGEARWFQIENPVTGLSSNFHVTSGPGGRDALLRFSLADASRVTISLLDMQGRERDRPMDGSMGAGSYFLPLGNASAGRGWYWLRFEAKPMRGAASGRTIRKDLPVFLGR